jgi:hypothetical protein
MTILAARRHDPYKFTSSRNSRKTKPFRAIETQSAPLARPMRIK